MPLEKLRHISTEELERLLNELDSERAVAGSLGVSQAAVSRTKRKRGIAFDGRKKANVRSERRKKQSEKLKEAWASGKMKSVLENLHSHEARKKSAETRKGRPTWNSGKGNTETCQQCGVEFKASKSKKRKYCSRKCASDSGALNSVGSGENNPNFGNGEKTKRAWERGAYKNRDFAGEKNPNFGNGDALKEAWGRGDFDESPRRGHTRGKAGYHDGIYMRSSWELAFAAFLDEVGIDWEYEKTWFKLSDGTRYVPDFYIPNQDRYIEIKGWWTERAKEKMALFRAEYPEINLEVFDDNFWM